MKDKYIIYFISKTKKYMEMFLEKQMKEKNIADLVPSHGNILTVLYESQEGQLKMKEIADKIGKDKSTVTALVNKLSDLGYVKKEESPTDKRSVYIRLTKKAVTIQEKYDAICEEVKGTAYKGFSEEEKQELLRLLKKLSDNFKE